MPLEYPVIGFAPPGGPELLVVLLLLVVVLVVPVVAIVFIALYFTGRWDRSDEGADDRDHRE